MFSFPFKCAHFKGAEVERAPILCKTLQVSSGSTKSFFLGRVISAGGIAVDLEQLRSFSVLPVVAADCADFSPTMFGEADQRFVQNFSGIVCSL